MPTTTAIAKKTKATKKSKTAKPARQAPSTKDSKKDVVIEMLRRDAGTSVAEIMKATEWQSHTVRGFLSGTVSKKMKLHLKTSKAEDGTRIYKLAS